MTNPETLQRCRELVLELRQMEASLRCCLPTGQPEGVKTQRYAAEARSTNDPTAAAIQLYEGLAAQRDALAQEASRLTQRAWKVIRKEKNVRKLTILNAYYLLGQTDQEIAHLHGVSREHICKLRHAAFDALRDCH